MMQSSETDSANSWFNIRLKLALKKKRDLEVKEFVETFWFLLKFELSRVELHYE